MDIIRTMNFIPNSDKYQSWKEFEGDNYDYCIPLTYIRNEFNFEDTILFSPILFPAFIVKDEAVFLQFLYSEERFDELRREMSLNKVEEIMNRFSLKDFFQLCQKRNDYLFDEMAEILAFSWRLSLKEKFPHKKFTICVSKGEDIFPIITFLQFIDWRNDPYSKNVGEEAMKMIPTLPFTPKMEKYKGKDNNLSFLDYIRNEFDFEDTILFSSILFPNFIVKDEAVFLQFLYSEERFDELRRKMSLSRVEEIMNCVSLKDFFQSCQNLSKDLFNEMAEILVFSWRLSLKEKFSYKEFTFSVSKGEDDFPMISFFEEVISVVDDEMRFKYGGAQKYDDHYWREKMK